MTDCHIHENVTGHLITLEDAKGGANLPRPAKLDITNEGSLKPLLKRHKINDSEFATILKIVSSAPTMAELGVFSAMWSEHCSYKSSRFHLKRFPTTGKDVVVGPGENAGVVRLHGSLCLAFKMESHNHPSYIEPYQGAATGVGGILRDVFCMGARPIANLNCLRFGDRGHQRTSYLVPRVVKGIGDYGNCVGIPTVGGSVSYDKSYNGNCLVNAMSVGLIRDDKIFKGFASGIGNLVVYVGSATGRDGIHGATMASDSFDSKANNQKTTIQVGDPFAEKLLLEATLEVLEKDLVVGIQDMGAAGLTSSSFEMAGRAGNGVYIDLDKIPVRAMEMTAYEILLSESQERMLMVVEPAKWQDLSEVLKRWQLAHAVVGVVTDTGRMQIASRGLLEVDLPVAPLTDEAPVYQRPIAPPSSDLNNCGELSKFENILSKDLGFARDIFLKVLSDSGSKEKIYEQYDRHIGAKSVLGPEHGGAAVMWIRSEETKDKPWIGAAMAAGCNERRVKNNPFKGAAEAVLKCARQIWAAGGNPIAITDCLNFGSPEDPVVMREFSDSVDGIAKACRELNVPVVSGNVSLYNATGSVGIHPTPMIGMVGRVDDVRAVTPANATEGENIYLLAPPKVSLSLRRA
jgi:phosphoribosylformylglycinamidine synthase